MHPINMCSASGLSDDPVNHGGNCPDYSLCQNASILGGLKILLEVILAINAHSAYSAGYIGNKAAYGVQI